jgi:hypothetical protein
MAKKDPTNITVYHTSTNVVPPHTLAARDEKYKNKLGLKPKGGFHAGTINAALDRSLLMHAQREQEFYEDPDNEDHPDGPDFTTYLHTYQINKRPSMITYEDPHIAGYGHTREPKDYVEDLRVNEHSTKGINK